MWNARFRLPPPERPRGQGWWFVASVLLHVVVGVSVAAVSGPTFTTERRQSFVLLEIGEGPRAVALSPYIPPGEPGDGGGGRGARPPDLALAERLVPVAPSRAPDSVIPFMPNEIVVMVSAGPGAAAADGEFRTDRVLGPAYGDGRLWVRPFIAQLGVVGPSPDEATHYSRVDRAVRERVQAFVDTMPRDSFALPPPTAWTTELGGNTWGIDRNWIYLGDLKLPTALLALLPFPQGNYDQAKAAQELQRMREDIIQAARRAETMEEFRKYVEELRQRKDAEREAQRAAKRDTVVP